MLNINILSSTVSTLFYCTRSIIYESLQPEYLMWQCQLIYSSVFINLPLPLETVTCHLNLSNVALGDESIELAARNLTAVYISQQVNLLSRFQIILGDSLQVTSESPENIENTIKVANLFKKTRSSIILYGPL